MTVKYGTNYPVMWPSQGICPVLLIHRLWFRPLRMNESLRNVFTEVSAQACVNVHDDEQALKERSEHERRIYPPWFREPFVWYTQGVRWQENGNIMLMSWGLQRRCWHREMIGFKHSWEGQTGGKHISSACVNEKWRLHRVTPILPFRLSELSLSLVEEMKSNDMLFVSQTKTSGSVQKWC